MKITDNCMSSLEWLSIIIKTVFCSCHTVVHVSYTWLFACTTYGFFLCHVPGPVCADGLLQVRQQGARSCMEQLQCQSEAEHRTGTR